MYGKCKIFSKNLSCILSNPLMNCGTNFLNTLYMLNNSFVYAESVLASPQKEKHTHTKETKKESINASLCNFKLTI